MTRIGHEPTVPARRLEKIRAVQILKFFAFGVASLALVSIIAQAVTHH
jgi:hypothetical protein